MNPDVNPDTKDVGVTMGLNHTGTALFKIRNKCSFNGKFLGLCIAFWNIFPFFLMRISLWGLGGASMRVSKFGHEIKWADAHEHYVQNSFAFRLF